MKKVCKTSACAHHLCATASMLIDRRVHGPNNGQFITTDCMNDAKMPLAPHLNVVRRRLGTKQKDESSSDQHWDVGWGGDGLVWASASVVMNWPWWSYQTSNEWTKVLAHLGQKCAHGYTSRAFGYRGRFGCWFIFWFVSARLRQSTPQLLARARRRMSMGWRSKRFMFAAIATTR